MNEGKIVEFKRMVAWLNLHWRWSRVWRVEWWCSGDLVVQRWFRGGLAQFAVVVQWWCLVRAAGGAVVVAAEGYCCPAADQSV